MFDTLISPTQLARHLDAPHWLIVDCRFDLARPDAGEQAYGDGHVPGAIYAHLERDLSAPRTPSSGRHPLPSVQRFASALGAWGVHTNTQVIAYDADNGAMAARLWWLLRWLGHRAVAVLDGGLKAWRAAALPETATVPRRTATTFRAVANRAAWVDADEVAARIAQPHWRVLDARAPERFAGTVEPIDPVAGHVPGARNHPFAWNLDASGQFLSPETLRDRIDASQAGVADSNTIVMCGSGVTACHLLLAMEIAGKPHGKLYAGSWSEWITDASRPVARSP